MSKRADGNWGCITAIALLICGCAIPYGFLSLTWGNAYTMCFGTPFPSHANVEKEAFFKLPASAYNIEYDVSGSESCTILAKFEMAPEDLDVFRGATLVKTFEPTQLDGLPYFTRESFSYFMQEKGLTQPTSLLAGSGSSNNPYTHQWIFVDVTNPSNFIVYIIADR